MSLFANVNGEIKELYRVFFNDNGVIREFKEFYVQNDNNEVKRVFIRSPHIPNSLLWVAKNDGTTINSMTNKGYTMSVRCTDNKRSIETMDRVYLVAGTKIRVEASNIRHESPLVSTNRVYIFLFETATNDVHVQSEGVVGTLSTMASSTMTVETSGNYYIGFTVHGRDANGHPYRCTADVNISILAPNN